MTDPLLATQLLRPLQAHVQDILNQYALHASEVEETLRDRRTALEKEEERCVNKPSTSKSNTTPPWRPN